MKVQVNYWANSYDNDSEFHKIKATNDESAKIAFVQNFPPSRYWLEKAIHDINEDGFALSGRYEILADERYNNDQ